MAFDKKKWAESLTKRQRELLDLEINTIDDSWFPILYHEFTKPYFLNLKEFLSQEKSNKQVVFPPAEDIYSWTRLTPFDKVKVVILGQDPYHNYNQAHGLAFSVKPPTPAPPSLKNMYIGLQNDYPDFQKPKNNGGYLIDWAKQGVLMLNASLTVRAHNANSHAGKGWESFTEVVLSLVAKNKNGRHGEPSPVCFLVWGNPASKRIDKIKPDLKYHKVLKTVHPSPLSASRGFFNAGHFRKTNEFLEEKYGPTGIVNWALGPGNKIKEIDEKLNSGQAEKTNPEVSEMHSKTEDQINLGEEKDVKHSTLEQVTDDKTEPPKDDDESKLETPGTHEGKAKSDEEKQTADQTTEPPKDDGEKTSIDRTEDAQPEKTKEEAKSETHQVSDEQELSNALDEKKD